MSRVKMRLVEAAIAVAEKRSFSKAAAALGETQATVTRQIQELESYLGVLLFDRRKGVKLTGPCKSFLEDSRLSVFHLDRAVYRARAAARGAEPILSFGSSPYCDQHLLSNLLSLRLPRYPKLKVRASSDFSHELSRQVLTGELDVALLAEGLPEPRLNFVHVATHPLYAVFPSKGGFSPKEVVSLSDFDRRGWVLFARHVHPTLYDRLKSIAQGAGLKPCDSHHVMSADHAAYLVLQFDAVAFMTRAGAMRVAGNGLTVRPLDEDGLGVTTSLVTRLDDERPLVGEFVRSGMRALQK
jgi:DNA-binding transcriptional LysR family regulator